jgi:hypothetical protein
MLTRSLILAGACGLGCAGPVPPIPSPCSPAPLPGAAASTSIADSAPPPLAGDEGMWLLSDFPSERLRRLHGFAPTQDWLDHVRLSAVRLAGGCSGSFVSPQGLVMTNHHCVSRCIEELSTAQRDYAARGFYAKSAGEEGKCPEIEVNQLVESSDVTERITRATAGLVGARYHRALEAEQARIEKACATRDEVRCDVVSLYHGGRYHLYRYRRYQDVRLVFAPEAAIAFFGGDPDNFMFPRYDLDVAFLRVYEDQHPLAATSYFAWSSAGAKEGDLTFVAGHPWGSSRGLSVAELEYLRDVALPARLLRLAEARGLMTEFQHRGPEQKRISNNPLFGIENGLKALQGRVEALRNPRFFAAKVAAEQKLRAEVDADPRLRKTCAGAWDAIREAEATARGLRTRYEAIEQGTGFWSELFWHARRLVRAAAELPKPNDQRLREYVDSQKPALVQSLLSPAPIYDELEILTLTHSLTKLREELGADHTLVRQVLGQDSPANLATRLVRGTRLQDAQLRQALFRGGQAAIEAAKDPMLELARLVDPAARAVRQLHEDRVEAVVSQNSTLIARARYELYGANTYPDATATLRLSFGQVRGFEQGGETVPPFTTLGGAFARATGHDPFALPRSWLDARPRLDLSTPLDFCTTNDIIGGNSGSPVLDREARVVGLIFDGNLPSLGGDYGYDPDNNRAVAVHGAAVVETLQKIYGASRIVSELGTVAGHGPTG